MTRRKVQAWATAVILFIVVTGMAYLGNQLVDAKWQQLTDYQTPQLDELTAFGVEHGEAEKIMVIVIDALPYDGLSYMPTVERLHEEYSGWSLTCPVPTQQLPVWTTLLTGTDPKIHGSVTGMHQPSPHVDTILDAADRGGYPVFFSGNREWEALVDRSATWTKYHFSPRDKDPGIAADEESTKAILAEYSASPRGLFVLNLNTATNTALRAGAHVHRESTFTRRLAALDELVGDVLDEVDLSKEALMVVGSHGSIPRGGWGGPESEARLVPMVMAGAGIAAESAGEAQTRDIAPTLATLLGVELPSHSTGLPLLGGMDLDDDAQLASISATASTQHSVYSSYLTALGSDISIPAPEASDMVALRELANSYEKATAEAETLHIKQDRSERIFIPLVMLLIIGVWAVILLRSEYLRTALLGIPFTLFLAHGLLYVLGARFSFSDFHTMVNFPMWVESFRGHGYLLAIALGMLSGLMIARSGEYSLENLFGGTLHILLTSMITLLAVVAAGVFAWGLDSPHILLPHSLWGVSLASLCFVVGIGQAAILGLVTSWIGARITVNWWLD